MCRIHKIWIQTLGTDPQWIPQPWTTIIWSPERHSRLPVLPNSDPFHHDDAADSLTVSAGAPLTTASNSSRLPAEASAADTLATRSLDSRTALPSSPRSVQPV